MNIRTLHNFVLSANLFASNRSSLICLLCLLTVNVIEVTVRPANAEGNDNGSEHTTTQINSPNDQHSLFDAIELLEHRLPLKKQQVENVFGIKLHPDASARMQGDRDRDIYTSDKSKSRPIAYMTLDELKKQSSRASGLLVIVWNPDVKTVTEKDIESKYGKPSLVEPQSVLDVPADIQPLTLNYTRDWGTLIFSVEKTKTHRLKQITIKALGETPALRPTPDSSPKH